MALRNTTEVFGAVAKAFHWAMALIIVAMVGLGWYMTRLPVSPTLFELYALHKATGMLVLSLLALRLAWRLINPVPALPTTLKPWERWAAHGTHFALYAVLFAMPISGWVINSASNFPLSFYGLFTIPNITGADEALKQTAETVHFYLSWILVALVAVHVGAALKHHFVARDDVLLRMLPRFTHRLMGRSLSLGSGK